MVFGNKRRKNKTKNYDPFAVQTGLNKLGLIESGNHHVWAEETFLPESDSKDTISRNFNFAKMPLIQGFIFLFILIILGKTAWLQIVKGDYYYSMAEGNRIRIERIEPKRGIIYDAGLRTLVRNQANFLIYFIPVDLPSRQEEMDKISSRLKEILGDEIINDALAELGKIKKRSLESYQPLFVADNIGYEQAMSLYLESADWPGVVLTNKTRREYLNSLSYKNDKGEEEHKNYFSLSHIMGYTGKINQEELKKFGQEYLPIDYIGKMGIEYFWENELKGKSGNKQIEVDALGKEKKIISQTEAEDGHNLVLSINLDLQLKLEEIIARHLEKLKLAKAAAVVLNPNNGEVISLISLPAYNNNSFAQGIPQAEYEILIKDENRPLYNRAINGEYPSGSTIKPVMSAAALQERIISENTTVRSVGGIRIGQWFFPDYQAGGHGSVNVKTAIANSVNTFFYYIGGGYEDFQGLGVDRIGKYFQLFGLGSQTGIDLAGEASGFIPTPEWKEEAKGERWYIGDTYHISIGQGDLLVTPLQVAAYTSVFANGGKLYRPHFIHQILTSDDKIVAEGKEEPVRENFIDDYNINVVREGMRQTVLAGSGRRLQSIGATAAGKTGTAQWSTKKPPHAWFIGFAPYENPELAITIIIEQAGEGHAVAVPIAQEFLEWYFKEYKTKTTK